ncbi:uncharacterized protein VTP21DRAFT_6869 [Calcarisporiella thermophila]|uniref:uncharacterized protein n=1 Tax=Calcarisporiella thermophila TaxID=911321 RepID=UPI0037420C0E
MTQPNLNEGPEHLHRLIFLNNFDRLRKLLAFHTREKPYPGIDDPDHRGMPPLHLAVQLGRVEMVELLLQAGASASSRNKLNWSALQEATSYGDRTVIELVMRRKREELNGFFQKRASQLVKNLSKELNDFYMELHWQFQSWVPFVSSLCPSDTYLIWKKGSSLRMDTTLVGFEKLKWIRGRLSFIFKVDEKTGPTLTVVDHVKKYTQRLFCSPMGTFSPVLEDDLAESISFNLNSEISATNIPMSAIRFVRSKAGLWGFRSNRKEKVGEFECSVWRMEGIELRTRVRTEHLENLEQLKHRLPRKKRTPAESRKKSYNNIDSIAQHSSDDISSRLSISSSRCNGSEMVDEVDDTSFETAMEEAEAELKQLRTFRPSLTPPSPPGVSYDDYFNPDDTQYLHLGRPLAMKESTKVLGATLWMCDESAGEGQRGFPLKIEQFLPVLEVLGMGSNRLASKLRDFISAKLPPGFPVRASIPVFPTLSAEVTFANYNPNAELSDALFAIPGADEGYVPGIVIKKMAEQE